KRGVEMLGGQLGKPSERAIAGVPQPPPRNSENPIPTQAGGALRQVHVIRMLQVEGQLRRGGVTVLRINFETAQDDLLQPRLNSRIECPRRHRIPPQPPPPSVNPLRFAERTPTRREEIQNDP